MKGLHKGKQHHSFIGSLVIGFMSLFCLQDNLLAQTKTSYTVPKAYVSTASDFIGKDADFMCLDMQVGPNGYIYMATNEGVKRFDGTQLLELHHTANNRPLLYEAIFRDKDDIWFISRSGFSKLKGDSIEPFSLPSAVLKMCNVGIEDLKTDSSGNLYVSPRHRGYFVLRTDGSFEHVVSTESALSGFVVIELDDGSLFHYSVLPKSQGLDNIGVYFMQKNEGIDLLTNTTYSARRYESSLVEHADGTHILSLGNRDLIRFKSDSLISHKKFEHIVIKLFVDRNDDLWIGTLDNGFFQVSDHDLENVVSYWDHACAVVTEDLNGGLWVKSDSLSFGYISQPAISHYSGATGTPHFEEVKWLLNSGENALALGPPRGIYTLDSSLSYVPIPFNPHEEGTRKTDINPITAYFDTISHKLWLGFKGKLGSWDGERWEYYHLHPDTFQNPYVVAISVLADGSLLGSTRRRLFRLLDGEVVPISNRSNLSLADFTTSPEGKVWITRKDGLWTLKNGVISKPTELHENEYSRLYWSTTYALGSLWLQPIERTHVLRLGENGLDTVFDQNGNPISLCCHSIAPNGDMWGASCEPAVTGIYRFFQADGKVQVEQFAFTDEAGKLRHDKLFLATRDAIYWASQYGLFTQKIENLVPENRNILTRIDDLRVNHKDRVVQKHLSLAPSENYINLAFNAISFQNLAMEFRYRMLGLDSSWVTTQYGQAQFTNLPSGKYVFEVQAHGKNGTGRWSEPAVLNLEIATPFWKTWWFRVSVALISLGFILLLFHLRSKQIRRKESAKAQIAIEMSQLELRALKAQVNPHFIFNAMSSVSYYLSTRKSEEAESYLQRFSKLVRIILENSEKNSVSLKDEVDLMKHYVSLESERFKGNTIQFTVSYNNVSATDVWVPPAIFQPYIENSIWHGLKNKEDPRHIQISFHGVDSLLRVVIEDNGIGREASKKLTSSRSKHHRSFGMMIATRRLEVLNRKNAKSLEIEDLYNSARKPLGTRISFYLPLIIKQTEEGFMETPSIYE